MKKGKRPRERCRRRERPSSSSSALSRIASDSTQAEAYLEGGRASVRALLEGFNGTIFAYGQSGSGKTFTMLGPDEVVDAIKEGGSAGIPEEVQEMYGLIPRAIGEIFEAINLYSEIQKGTTFQLSVQYLEIYNEQVMDLLSRTAKDAQNLKMREMPDG